MSDEIYFGHRIVTLQLYPVSYTPFDKELYVNSFDVTIEYDLEASIDDVQGLQSKLRMTEERNFIASIVANGNDLQRFYTPLARSAQSLATGDRTISVKNEPLKPDYIIITRDSLQASFKDLVEWKRKKGVYAILKTVEEISKSFQGSDLTEQIRNYLKEQHVQWGSSLYVLLGGNVDLVPTRFCVGIKGTMESCDPYYANVAGNYSWNNNGNHIYGEYTDGVPQYANDMNIGRIPVENKQEIKNFIGKILSYEKADGIASDPSYYKNRLITAARLDDRVSNIGIMSGLYSFYSSYLKNYANVRFLFDEWKVTTNPDPLCALFTKQNFLSALENGMDALKHFHIVYHMDHSGPQAMGTSAKKRIEGIGNKDVDKIKNGKFYQIVMSGGCHPASIHQDCIAEHFLNNPEGGAVAFIGNSDSGYAGEYPQYQELERALFSLKKHSLSDLYRQAALYSSDGNKTWRLHLLGDPQMSVWADTPKSLNVGVVSQKDANGDYLLTITPRQQFPDSAYVCLYKDGDIYHTEYIRSGETRFLISPKSSGILNMMITSPNYIPYETSFAVESKNLNTLSIDTVFINDVTGSNCVGNSNGKLEAGETVLLAIRLKNTGNVAISQLKATVSCSSDQVTLYSNNVTWGNMSPGATATAQVRLTVNKELKELLSSDPNAIRFAFAATDANGKGYYLKEVALNLYHSNLGAERREIVSTGNGNLTIEPGETVDMKIWIVNYGQGRASGITASLVGTSVSSSTTVNYPNIEGHGQAVSVVPLSFKVSASYKAGTALDVTLKIQNQFGKVWECPVNLTETSGMIVSGSLKYTCDESSIQIYWGHQSVFKGYTLYRSSSDANGNDLNQYKRLNYTPLTSAYYMDRDVQPLTKYYYKVATLSATGAESDYSASIPATTSFRSMGVFPVPIIDIGSAANARIDNSTFAVDVNNDGYAELFTGVRTSKKNPISGVNTITSFSIVKDHNGIDLFDIDANVTTNSGFSEMSGEFGANPAICQLTKDGEFLVFFANRSGENGSSLFCYSFEDANSDGKPDMRWEKKIPGASFCSSVIADDLDGDGTKELILRSETGPIYVYSVTNDNLYSFGPGNEYMDVAVADLNGDGKKEIIAGSRSGGVCIYKYDGTPFSSNPVFTRTGCGFHSTPVVCDLDNDGVKEILIMGRKADRATAVFAFKPNGTSVTGWDGSQVSEFGSCTEPQNMYQNISVGDLDHDGNLEVVVPGEGNVRVWRNNGTLWSKIVVEGLSKQGSPILADVDDDNTVEILVGVQEKIYAFHANGTNVKGFPLILEDQTRATPCVADIDNDGENEVVACSRSKMYVWKTPGDADNIEWGMERQNTRNTGEYACPSQTIRTNTTWSQPYSACGDLWVNSGTLTLNSGCTLRMGDNAGLVVNKGATLTLDGGKIENADVWIKAGGSIQLMNEGKITLRKGGFFEVQKGGTMDYSSGEIRVTK